MGAGADKRTTFTEEEIGEYSGAKKEIRPVTIATYQVMTTKRGGYTRTWTCSGPATGAW